jgi:nucleotide-binding universal stress UspA family protein
MARCILVPLDGSVLSESALPRAAALAKLFGEHLHIVRVHTPVLAYALAEAPVVIADPSWDAEVRKNARDWLEKRAAELKSSLGIAVTFELRAGTPGEQIVEAAREHDARMIVCTTHGTNGWAPQWLGSVTDDVIRHAANPVLAMSEAATLGAPELRKILLPLDGTVLAAAILPDVRDLARASGATVDLYRVVGPPWVGDVADGLPSGNVDRFGQGGAADLAKVEIDRTAEDLRLSGVRSTVTVEVSTNPTRAILNRIAATLPDVVAMATHGRGMSRLFVGSVADKVLRAGGRPVLCWRPPRTSTPDDDSARMFATAASGPTA